MSRRCPTTCAPLPLADRPLRARADDGGGAPVTAALWSEIAGGQDGAEASAAAASWPCAAAVAISRSCAMARFWCRLATRRRAGLSWRRPRPVLPPRPLDVLIGGLGVGHALDEALTCPVSVGHRCRVRAGRVSGSAATAAPGRGRCGDRGRTISCDDVLARLVAAPARYDLVALDTDNGPSGSCAEENGGLYAPTDCDGPATRPGRTACRRLARTRRGPSEDVFGAGSGRSGRHAGRSSSHLPHVRVPAIVIDGVGRHCSRRRAVASTWRVIAAGVG